MKTLRKKKNLVTILGLMAVALLVGLVAAPGADAYGGHGHYGSHYGGHYGHYGHGYGHSYSPSYYTPSCYGGHYNYHSTYYAPSCHYGW